MKHKLTLEWDNGARELVSDYFRLRGFRVPRRATSDMVKRVVDEAITRELRRITAEVSKARARFP
jgi:hypothetical protein